MKKHSKNWVVELIDNEYVIIDHLFSKELINSLRMECDELFRGGCFRRAHVGKQPVESDRIRRDYIMWWDRDHPTLAQEILWNALGVIQKEVNEAAFFGIWDFQGHYSLYPPGSFYKRHLDRFRDDDRRILSFVLYLNERWDTGDGGQLRLYTGSGDSIDVLPTEGRVVLFLSDALEHEVLPTERERMSLTGWFRRRAMRSLG